MADPLDPSVPSQPTPSTAGASQPSFVVNSIAPAPAPTVHTSNIFIFNGQGLSQISSAGSFETNAAIRLDAGPRARVETSELLSNGPSATVAGAQQSTNRLSSSALLGRIAPGAAIVNGANDTANVGQHVVQGNGAEAVTEGLGVAGQAGGAGLGGTFGYALGAWLLPSGVPGVLALIGGTTGAYLGSTNAKEFGAFITGGATPDKLGPPLTLPGNLDIPPALTTADGSAYALVQVEGKSTWFAITENPNLPRYVEVTSGPRLAELTDGYLQASGFEPQFQQFQAQAIEQQRHTLQDAFVRSEINHANSIDPNGQPWGTTVQVAPNASQTWSQSPQPGQALHTLEVRSGDNVVSRIVQTVDRASGKTVAETVYESATPTDPSSFKLVGVADYETGVTWAIDRATGQMTQGGTVARLDNEPFNPLPSTGSPGGSYTIQNNDSLWNIGKSMNLTDAQIVRFIEDTKTSYTEQGLGGNVHHLLPGRTIALPDWLQTHLAQQVSDAAQDAFRKYEIAEQNQINSPLEAGPGALPGPVEVVPDDPLGQMPSDLDLPPVAGPVAGTPAPTTDSYFEQIVDVFTNTPVPAPGPAIVVAGDGVLYDGGHITGWANGGQSPTPAPAATPSGDPDFYNDDYVYTPTGPAPAAVDWQTFGHGVSLINTLMSLGQWDELSDIQRLGLLAGGYQTFAGLSGGSLTALPGAVPGVIGLLGALDSGNPLAIASAGAQLGSQTLGNYAASLTDSAWSGLTTGELTGDIAIGMLDDAMSVGSVAQGLGQAVPFLNLALALESGNPWSIAASAVAFIPVWGQIAAVFISVLGMFFGDDDPPVQIGHVTASWNDSGELDFTVQRDEADGGKPALSIAQDLATGLDGRLDDVRDADGNRLLELIPGKLPGIGWHYDPNANNTDRVQLHYTDENGQPQTRYYDDQGNQVLPSGHLVYGSGGLGADYAQYSQDAIAPAFVVQVARETFTEQVGQAVGIEQEIEQLQREADAIAPRQVVEGHGQDAQVYIAESPDPARHAALTARIHQLQGQATGIRQDALVQILSNVGRAAGTDREIKRPPLEASNDPHWQRIALLQ